MKSLCADTDAPGFTTHLVQHLARERDSGLHRRTACSTCPRARARVRARARARARGVLQKTVQRYKRCPSPRWDPVPLSRYVRYGERSRRSSNGRESTYHVGITTHAAWANRRIPTPKAMGGATSRARGGPQPEHNNTEAQYPTPTTTNKPAPPSRRRRTRLTGTTARTPSGGRDGWTGAATPVGHHPGWPGVGATMAFQALREFSACSGGHLRGPEGWG